MHFLLPAVPTGLMRLMLFMLLEMSNARVCCVHWNEKISSLRLIPHKKVYFRASISKSASWFFEDPLFKILVSPHNCVSDLCHSDFHCEETHTQCCDNRIHQFRLSNQITTPRIRIFCPSTLQLTAPKLKLMTSGNNIWKMNWTHWHTGQWVLEIKYAGNWIVVFKKNLSAYDLAFDKSAHHSVLVVFDLEDMRRCYNAIKWQKPLPQCRHLQTGPVRFQASLGPRLTDFHFSVNWNLMRFLNRVFGLNQTLRASPHYPGIVFTGFCSAPPKPVSAATLTRVYEQHGLFSVDKVRCAFPIHR